jgi:hypothetical protein
LALQLPKSHAYLFNIIINNHKKEESREAGGEQRSRTRVGSSKGENFKGE